MDFHLDNCQLAIGQWTTFILFECNSSSTIHSSSSSSSKERDRTPNHLNCKVKSLTFVDLVNFLCIISFYIFCIWKCWLILIILFLRLRIISCLSRRGPRVLCKVESLSLSAVLSFKNCFFFGGFFIFIWEVMVKIGCLLLRKNTCGTFDCRKECSVSRGKLQSIFAL